MTVLGLGLCACGSGHRSGSAEAGPEVADGGNASEAADESDVLSGEPEVANDVASCLAVDASTWDAAHVGDGGALRCAPLGPSGWCRFEPPLGTLELRTVWSNGPGDVWAGGIEPHLLHFDGAAWTSIEDLENAVDGVWGSGPNDVWVVGEFFDQGDGIFHWNGRSWTRTPTPHDGEYGGYMTAVWGGGPDDVWALGQYGIMHWDGCAWSQDRSPAMFVGLWSGVWGSGPRDIWATAGGTRLHWDGTAWSDTLDLGGPFTTGVWGSSPTDVWTSGDVIGHYDGAVWTKAWTPPFGMTTSIWGSGPRDIWVAGQSIAHYDGTSWSVVQDLGGAMVNHLSGTGANDVWAVGDAGEIFHYAGAAPSR
ncbi:MAG TPA: hypothetical protein VHL80_10960 [Polyangia bacterium]|nr:hypothetical protein [Polyangia bacterium]